MRYHAKLPISMPSLCAPEKIDEVKEYTKLQRFARKTTGHKVAFRSLHFADAQQYLQYLPECLLAQEVPAVFILEAPAVEGEAPVIPPHIDYRRLCGLNIYLEASGEITQFYTWDAKTKTNTVVEQFVAQPGDCWLLDTSVPHGVLLIKNKARRMLTFSFSQLTFGEVLAHVEQHTNGAQSTAC
jgi:hypothetical protein